MPHSSSSHSPAAPASSSAPPLLRTPRRLRRRRRPLKTPTATSTAPSGRRGGPATPQLRWGSCGSEDKPNAEKARGAASVRRLAAAVWRLRPTEAEPAPPGASTARVGLEHIPRHLQVQLLKKNPLSHHHGLKNEISSPNSVLEPHSGELHKVQLHLASAVLPVTSMENATKWEPESIKGIESDGAYLIASQLNLIDKQGEIYAASLQMELQQARDRVDELEAERLSAKKQLDHLLKKLAVEKAAWRSREHKKVQAILEDMKADFEHEKKNRRRLETINLKLVDELKEVKMAAKQLLQEYDNERKTRELTEEVCNKLVSEVEEHKAEIEDLKQDSLKLQEEVDEDRKLLQMAEVWREERVQMKLVDAKLTLEAKYAHLSKLQQDVEAFMSTFNCTKGDSRIVRAAENIIQVIGSVREQEIEFMYEPPPASENILSIFEELRPSEEPEIRETEQRYKHRSAVYESEIQEISPMADDIILEKPAKVFSNRSPCNESETEDASSWETISHEEMQGSSCSPDGSEPSVNKTCDRMISWTSGNDSEGGKNEKLSDDWTYLTDMKQPKKKESAISKLWKSSPLKNREICKKDAVEMMNGRSSDVKLSNGMYSTTEGTNQEIGLSSPSIDQWSSPDSMNSQLNRGFRGCLELVQKQSLKAKLLEARMESQKVQLRHVLNQKT